MVARRAEDIVAEAVRRDLNPKPRATKSLHRPLARLLPRPAASHANWRGLSRVAVSALFVHLPVLDLFRLGHLFSPRWLQIWRGNALELHDAQFACLPVPSSGVANAIDNALDKYLAAAEDDDQGEDGAVAGGGIYGPEARGRVKSFRVESTEWRAEHAARWCAALKRGGAIEVVLFNRGFSGDPPVLFHVPRGLLGCARTVRVLHLGFFTVEAGQLDALRDAIQLGLHGCACRPGVVEGVVAACRQLEKLWVHDGSLEQVAVRSAPRLWRLSMLRTASRSLTVDDAPILEEIFLGSADTLSISRAPMLSLLMCLDLATTTSLVIQGVQIAVDRMEEQPQMRSVFMLRLIVDYAALGDMAPRAVEQMLRRFPYVCNLFIQRKDDVLEAEGLASRTDRLTQGDPNLFAGVDCVARKLRILNLVNFQGGKAELALAKAILAKATVLGTIVLTHGERPGIRDALLEADQALKRGPRNYSLFRIFHQTMSSFEKDVHGTGMSSL